MQYNPIYNSQFIILEGDILQTILKTGGASALISFFLTLPFMIMEFVNRRDLNEDFPFALFFVLWLNLFAVSLILLPIGQGKWAGKRDGANSLSTQEGTLLTKPKPAALISLTLLLFILFLAILTSFGWEPLDRLINGPNPEQVYLPGVFISLILIAIPIAAGIIAAQPIVSTVRSGGSLFAHPLLLIIVVTISFFFLTGVVGLLIDQWPCFIGVPRCD